MSFSLQLHTFLVLKSSYIRRCIRAMNYVIHDSTWQFNMKMAYMDHQINQFWMKVLGYNIGMKCLVINKKKYNFSLWEIMIFWPFFLRRNYSLELHTHLCMCVKCTKLPFIYLWQCAWFLFYCIYLFIHKYPLWKIMCVRSFWVAKTRQTYFILYFIAFCLNNNNFFVTFSW